jgi:DNA helicase-2/ATP-dependent DNA helicase PcrA
MDVTPIIDSLNDAQRQAVTAPAHAMLVLAGAGSGKTRVLVHRIAWQIQVNGFSPHSMLAVTFTNKAAREMRGRIETLLHLSAQGLWIGTFHGLAHRLLRRHAERAGLPDTFQVMDTSDQLRVIKRVLNLLNYDAEKWDAKQIQWHINAQKDEGLRADMAVETNDDYQRHTQAIYQAYQDHCNRSGLVDFAELLLRAYELLRDNPDILAHYQHRFQQVHVDEFQDTNTIQYLWLLLLTEGRDNLFVVGDDDQSIYGWRGAKIENIRSFQRHYPHHQVVKLEQNYRSTGTILKAANKLIASNQGRMGKELWTQAGVGEPIALYSAFNEQDEAYFVVERIRAWVAGGGARRDVAILYRSNVQSRQFEEKLMATGTPYRVYGGLRFFDRVEIKNALAYLRLMANRNDDASFERIINTPTRGIGAKTVDEIRALARTHTVSLWTAAVRLLKQGSLSARAGHALDGFLRLVTDLRDQTTELELAEKVKLAIEKSGLITLYEKDKADKGEEKIDNLKDLVSAAQLFDTRQAPDDDEPQGELEMFLTHASLESGELQGDDFDDCVQLMTLHSAKGLEFKLVFLVGMEEGLFPSQQSTDDVGRLEEERRLCYVGITRAMQQLYLTHSESRWLYGQVKDCRPSRFLREIPADTVQEVRPRAQISRPVTAVVKPKAAPLLSSSHYKVGQKVQHEKFGAGVILQIEGEGAQERVQVKFATVGIKWLMLSFAKLEVV